jgi:pyruvate/2-oxoacid:ferredoxin oxidoreductase beta subunit
MGQEGTSTSISSYFVDQLRFPFCKGCGHQSVLRRLNDALVSLQLPPEKVALVTDIGCIGLADALFKDVHTVHTTHGRSTAFATGIALADSLLADGKLKTIVLIGDGGAMIGLQHLVHAAMLNVDVTVLICNNFVYGMTGGQGSGLTPECFVTASTPKGNIVRPVDICEILKASNAPFVARTVVTDRSLPNLLAKAIAYDGFAAVEILELCTEFAVPQNELDGQRLNQIAEKNGWDVGILAERMDRSPYAVRYREEVLDKVDEGSRVDAIHRIGSRSPTLKKPVNILLAGSAGERVQSSAGLLAAAAVAAGLNITQKNDNPVTQGSGFSLVELWLSPHQIGFTGIERPDFLLVTSADGWREMQSQRVFARLDRSSALYLDETLQVPESDGMVHRLKVRSVFGGKDAALGLLVFVILRHEILARDLVLKVMREKYRGDVDVFLARLQQLEMESRQESVQQLR